MAGLWQATAEAIQGSYRAKRAGRQRQSWLSPRLHTAMGSTCSTVTTSRSVRCILSLDSRAGAIVDRWADSPVFGEALATYGTSSARLGPFGPSCLAQGHDRPLSAVSPIFFPARTAALCLTRRHSGLTGPMASTSLHPMSAVKSIHLMHRHLRCFEELVRRPAPGRQLRRDRRQCDDGGRSDDRPCEGYAGRCRVCTMSPRLRSWHRRSRVGR